MVRPEDVAKMNPWWSLGLGFAADDKDLAKLNSSIFKFRRGMPELKLGNIYVIKGPRRVGKTLFLKSLVLELLEKGVDKLSIFYYSLDSVKSSNELSNMLHDFLGNLGRGTRYILLDEAQSVEGWEKVIQAFANEGLLKNAITIVTGSLAHVLRQELMPGRGTEGNTYLMRPLPFGEFCLELLSLLQNQPSRQGKQGKDLKSSQNDISKISSPQYDALAHMLGDEALHAELLNALATTRISLEESIEEIYAKANALVPYANPLKKMFNAYMRTGGYPASINSFFQELTNKPQFSIAQQIFEELYLYAKNDAATLAGAGKSGNPVFAEAVLRSTLEHIGENISYTKLSKSASMNTKTFIEYSERLRESYVFLALSGINKNLEQIRLKKVYFADPLLHYSVGSAYTGWEPNRYTDAILNSGAVGIVAEEIVAAHLAQTKEDEPMRRYDTYLHFLKDKKEMDFVYKRNDGSYLGIEVKYQNSVSAKNDLYSIDGIDENIIISKDTMEKGEDYITLPAYLLLAALEKSKKDL
jgi:predicted AAA+ superfamily ATPase